MILWTSSPCSRPTVRRTSGYTRACFGRIGQSQKLNSETFKPEDPLAERGWEREGVVCGCRWVCERHGGRHGCFGDQAASPFEAGLGQAGTVPLTHTPCLWFTSRAQFVVVNPVVFLAVVSRPCRHSTRAHRHIICLFPSLSPLARSRTITVVAMFAVLHHWCSHHHLNVPFLTTKGVALSHSLSSPIRLLFTLLGSHVSERSRLSVILLDVPCTASTLRACVGAGVWLCARRRTHNFAFTRCQSGCNGVTEQCTWVCMPLKRVSNESTSYSHSHTCPAVLRTAANRRGLRT